MFTIFKFEIFFEKYVQTLNNFNDLEKMLQIRKYPEVCFIDFII